MASAVSAGEITNPFGRRFYKTVFALIIAALLGNVFFPTTKEMAAILVVPQIANSEKVQAEIIADGFHIHPASVRLAFTMFRNRMVLVSDSGRCAGKDEGYQFDLGGQMAEIRGGVAKLVGTETIACSASNMWACLKNVLSWGIPEEEAVRAATYNPAKAIGALDVVGSIEEGKRADFLVVTPGYESYRVFLAGKEI